MAQEIKCVVDATSESGCTYIKQQTIYDKDFILSSSSANCVTNTAIRFDSCMMNAFPSSDSIKKFMPKLEGLFIHNSTLSKITAEDLKGFGCLKDLVVSECGIEYLPGDLFKHTPHLEIVAFACNKIKYIDEDILEPLQNLEVFNLLNNVNIDAWYFASDNEFDTFAKFKHEIATKCKKPTPPTIDELLVKITTLEANQVAQKKEIEFLKKKLETVQLNQAIEGEAMNFTIKVNEKHFVVNKALLVANSEVLAQLITENPEADSLELKDISVATFQEILNFMNEGSEPGEDADMVELFGASCRLKIEGLSAVVAEMLKDEVNQDNAFNVLAICNKFGNYNELKTKAFSEYKKNFPQQQLAPELASQTKKLKVLMQAKLDMDKALADIQAN